MMVERALTIANKQGLHARPAAAIVKTAAKFSCKVTLKRDDLEVNGKSIMGVMMLAAEFGATIHVCAEGEDAAAAVDAIEALVKDGFGEP